VSDVQPQVLLAPEVEAELTPAERRSAVNPGVERARCALCNEWADAGEALAVSLVVAGTVRRTFSTHPHCAPSRLIRSLSEDPGAAVPGDGFDAAVLAVRWPAAPHAAAVVEMTGPPATGTGSADVVDLVDAFVSTLVVEGLVPISRPGDDVPLLTGWRAVVGDGQLEIESPDRGPVYWGPVDAPVVWLEAVEAAGRLVVVTGSSLGIRDPDPWPSLDAAMQAGRAFAGVVPAIRRVAHAGRNAPCPCRSGRKYKHCHGR
jgi:hypothetical protein